MLIKKSPSGSSFPYYYKGGEIHALKYGSYFRREDDLLKVMKAEEEFIQKQHGRLRIWVDFYETTLSDRVINEFLESIERVDFSIIKLAIVGLVYSDRHRLNKCRKKLSIKITGPVKFFEDPEDAKTWLVSEKAQ